MQLFFEDETERNNVAATLNRLIETISERSHSTAEHMNLCKAFVIVKATPTKEELR